MAEQFKDSELTSRIVKSGLQALIDLESTIILQAEQIKRLESSALHQEFTALDLKYGGALKAIETLEKEKRDRSYDLAAMLTKNISLGEAVKRLGEENTELQVRGVTTGEVMSLVHSWVVDYEVMSESNLRGLIEAFLRSKGLLLEADSTLDDCPPEAHEEALAEWMDAPTGPMSAQDRESAQMYQDGKPKEESNPLKVEPGKSKDWGLVCEIYEKHNALVDDVKADYDFMEGKIGLLETAQDNHAKRLDKLESTSHIHPPITATEAAMLDNHPSNKARQEPWPKLPMQYESTQPMTLVFLQEFARWRKLFGIKEEG